MYVGQRVKRKEDLKILTGNARYVDDIDLPNQLFLAIKRSDVPHARIKKIDYSDALKLKGVRAVITGLSVPLDARPRNFPMAVDEILYVGQPVAAVLAEDRYTAYDALDYIIVEYEDLPAVSDPEEALRDEVKAVEGKSNVAYKKVYKGGKPEEAFERSERKVEAKIEITRVAPSAMEPRGMVIEYQGDRLTVYASTQSPHYMRSYLLKAFEGKVSDIRVIQADVGGAFGSKLFPYPEEFIAVYAALTYRTNVKWVNTRREDFLTTYHARGQTHKVKVGFNKDGRINAVIDDLIIDLGAGWHGTYLADIAATLVTGPYKIENVLVNVYGVLTNKTPLDQYRGAGRPEAAFVYERIMDIVADELGMDPVELRKRNLIDQLPYTNPLGIKYDSGNYRALLERAEAVYRTFEKKAEELRKQGRRVGVGLSFYVEQNNFGPWEAATVRLLSNGKVQVVIGAAPHGQGTGTGIAQVIADELQISIDDVEVVWGDTNLISNAFGTYGSRSLTLAGNAALLATRRLKENIMKLAAAFMKSDVEELMYKDGKVINPKTNQVMTLKEIAEKATRNLGGVWRYRAEPTLEASATFGFDNYTFPYGSHVALVEVAEDGKVKVLDYYAIDDIGLVVNPMLAEGQVHGGTIQSFGEAVLEEVVYDERAVPLTQGFAEYALPTAVEAFNMKWEYMEVGKSEAPLPAKGIGEGATIGGPPAIIRAIERAVGKRITRLPVKAEDLV